MNVTFKPLKRQTLRDAKVGATFVFTLGYGSPDVAFEAVITGRDKHDLFYDITWSAYDGAKVQSDYMFLKVISQALKPEALMFIGVRTISMPTKPGERERRQIVYRDMTDAEKAAKAKKDEEWERFTKSETYQSM